MSFKGDKKVGQSILVGPENRLKSWLLPLVPECVETYHLTLTTILWSLGIIAFSFLASRDIRWLWMASLMIVLQYVTDLLDGAIGRQRNTGLVKWGFYMDHFLDYIFLCAILIGYSLLLPDQFKYALFFVLALFGAFMVNSFLTFAATNEFRISYMGIGPTEIRIVFILVNTMLILFGRTHLARALPWVLGLSTFGLFITAFNSHRELWALDMRNKHGEQEPGINHGPRAFEAFRQLFSAIFSKQFLRNMGFSALLAAASVTVVMMRIMHPYHRHLAVALYVLSWIPLLLSIITKRSLVLRRGQAVGLHIKPYRLHIGVAAILIAAGYIFHVLIPIEDSLLTQMTRYDLRQNMTEDLQSLKMLRSSGASLLEWTEKHAALSSSIGDMSPQEKVSVREFWAQFHHIGSELDLLKAKYKGFYQIDFLRDAGLHSDAFLIGYGAFVTQYAGAQRLVGMIGDNSSMEALLNEKDPDRDVQHNSLQRIKGLLVHPEQILRLNSGRLYLPLIRKHSDAPQSFAEEIERTANGIYKLYTQQPEMLVDNPLDFFERRAFAAWFPLQKQVATTMSFIRTSNRDFHIKASDVGEYRDWFEPGDILVERRNWFMTNVGIPGFWPHAALYFGTPQQLDSYFDGSTTNDSPATEILKQISPQGFAALITTGEMNHKRCVIEAIRDGMVFTSLEKSAHADYLGVLRPNVSRADKFRAICTAMSHFGKPYDYNFDFATDSALVCSELVFKSYQHVNNLGLTLQTVNGRLMLPPNSIVKSFDAQYDNNSRALDFVLFLESTASGRPIRARDVNTFRNSWSRPKWDILLEGPVAETGLLTPSL